MSHTTCHLSLVTFLFSRSNFRAFLNQNCFGPLLRWSNKTFYNICMDGTTTHTTKHTYIVTYRLNRARGRFSKKLSLGPNQSQGTTKELGSHKALSSSVSSFSSYNNILYACSLAMTYQGEPSLLPEVIGQTNLILSSAYPPIARAFIIVSNK